MTEERHEVYERIPWETLEKKGGDRQWMLMAFAGAVVVGALAYSFMQNQPSASQSRPTVAISEPATPAAAAPASTVASPAPIVMAEADLYAVDPERLADRAAAHAEWFAVEYFTYDGSEQSRSSLQALMPGGLPLSEASEGTHVFVDWVGTQTVTEVRALTYDVEVLVRSLRAVGDESFIRQPLRTMTVEIVVGDDGMPRVSRPPQVSIAAPASVRSLTLSPLPADLNNQVETAHGPVLGGEQMPDGRWRVVVMAVGVDGVRRPVTVVAP